MNPLNSCCDEKCLVRKAEMTVALVGNPNCGKTTLFNALTGARQRVGNWPGVTVERKSGFFTQSGVTVEVIDLPGIYSTLLANEAAIDERIACEFILQEKVDLVINIVDASNLERHLYLTTQLLEMQVPVLLALNMMDVAESKQIKLDLKQLSRELNCPVIALKANKGGGVQELKCTIVNNKQVPSTTQMPLPYPDVVQKSLDVLTQAITDKCGTMNWWALRLLEDDLYARHFFDEKVAAQVKQQQTHILQTSGEEADILIADARYRFIEQTLKTCTTKSTQTKPTWTTYIDNIVLNRFLGIPIFLSVMYCLFLFAINIGGGFQDFFDISSQTIFVEGLGHVLTEWGAPSWLTVLLANGVGKGINTTITFIPVIGAMFLFLALLEDSGYMARAAFVIDRFMRALGLPGKAFVPMIVGFGCNVPAVMAARALENKRDRILTIMMSPFMSCGARLAIYAVFTAAFFPHGGQNIVFALYLIGIAMAIFTGYLLRVTVLKGDPAPLIMELPPYHLPHIKTVLLHAWQRLKGFVFRAGKLIVPICVLLGALNSLNIDGSINSGEGDTHSILSLVGQWVTPLFSPMGLHADNWPATVGLVTGILAKEVVVGTLNTLYSQVGHFAAAGSDSFHLLGGLTEALRSIPENFAQLGGALANPVLAKAPIHAMNQGVYGLMAQRFDGKAGAFAYLLFILLYFPCVSTTAVMLRELHRGWSIFSVFWMTGVAYVTAVVFYQAATWLQHPYSSTMWIVSMIALFLLTIAGMRWFAKHEPQRVVIAGEEAYESA